MLSEICDAFQRKGEALNANDDGYAAELRSLVLKLARDAAAHVADYGLGEIPALCQRCHEVLAALTGGRGSRGQAAPLRSPARRPRPAGAVRGHSALPHRQAQGRGRRCVPGADRRCAARVGFMSGDANTPAPALRVRAAHGKAGGYSDSCRTLPQAKIASAGRRRLFSSRSAADAATHQPAYRCLISAPGCAAGSATRRARRQCRYPTRLTAPPR